MNPWLILPFKSIAHGKSRLAPVLETQQRREINRRLLLRALTVGAAYPGPQRTMVVSHCAQVLAIARRHGCRTLAETPGSGLNAALECTIDRLRDRGAGELLLMSCDLPFAQASDLRTLVQLGRQGRGPVLATDRPGTGTNALYLPAGARIRLHYGPGSCLQHSAEAQRQGLSLHVVRSASLAFDVDWPADLREWSSRAAASRGSLARGRVVVRGGYVLPVMGMDAPVIESASADNRKQIKLAIA